MSDYAQFDSQPTKPSPEAMAKMKEDRTRALFNQNICEAIGPFILGYVFALVMLGILLGQWWDWFKWTERERTFVRTIVYIVLVGSLASSVYAMTWFQHLLVDHYSKYAQFLDPAWFSWFAPIDVFVIVGCQAFNLDRAYRINQNNIWVILGIAPSMFVTVAVVISRKVVQTQPHLLQSTGSKILKPLSVAYFVSILVTDIALTATIAWGLWRSKTGWQDTDLLIKRLTVYTVETQLLPTVMAMATFIQFVIKSDTSMVYLWMLCYSKLPAVMMMAVLNHRLRLRRRQTDATVVLSSRAWKRPVRTGWFTSTVDDGKTTSREVYALGPLSTEKSNNESQVPLEPAAGPSSFHPWQDEHEGTTVSGLDTSEAQNVQPSISVVHSVPYNRP